MRVRPRLGSATDARSGAAINRLFSRLSLGLAVLGLALVLAARFGGVFDAAELASVDARFELRGETAPPSSLLVVGIDDATFTELRLRWPFPRSVHADVIKHIAADGAAAIVYDIQFSEETTPEEDNELILAVADAGNVVLAATEVAEDGSTNVFGGLPLEEIDARAGSALFSRDRGVIRKVAHEIEGLPTLAVAAVETATGGSLAARGEQWIDFHGGAGSIETISFSQVAQQPADFFAGRIVVIGASAPTLQDLHATSTAEVMSGPELEAHAISSLLRGSPLTSSPSAVDVALIVVLGLLPALVARRLSLRVVVGLATVLALAYLVASQLSFNEGIVLPILSPLIALALSTIAVVGTSATASRLEREQARSLFARFVPENVVDEVLEQAGADLRLGGVELDGTALFVDLRAFTQFVERHGPEIVLRVLNRYLETASNAVHAHGGTVVAFQGDGVMAVFGAPLAQDDHAERALACARSLVHEGLPAFNTWLAAEGFAERFGIGVGLASGTLRSGNVGSADRVEYAAIGDATNTAARLQGMTRDAGLSALIAGSVLERLARAPGDVVDAGQCDVRGKREPVPVFTFAPLSEPAAEPTAASTLAE